MLQVEGEPGTGAAIGGCGRVGVGGGFESGEGSVGIRRGVGILRIDCVRVRGTKVDSAGR